jgi:uroporphyrinogen-III decarboxylase
MMKWPGHGVGENRSFQYLDLENLKADEYDEFLFDPTDFMIRKFWPRVFGSLSAFSELPKFRSIIGHMGFNRFAALDTSEIDTALEVLNKARKQAVRNTEAINSYVEKMEGLGFPPIFGGAATVPFDLISDQFRGTRGAMIDMYRNPDKLQAAMDKVLPMMLEGAIAAAEKSGCKRVFIPLHKGQEYFMSEEQYKKFYWPGYRALMMGLIDAGLTPCSLVEGEYTSRLEIISDVPKGKVLYHFERVDILKAKEILGDIACIRGGIPITMMCTSTPQQIEEHCKWLIENIGKGGGFILDAGVALDDAKPENVRAMFEATREYGVY